MTDVSNAPLLHSAVNNTAKSRYEIDTQGVLSIADYEIRDGVITFTHTLTPPQLRGRGIAARLIHAALEDVKTKGLKVVPACWFVGEYIERNPQYQGLLK
jgi:uncharacterized protein